MEYKNNNDLVEIIQPTKKAKRKEPTIIKELKWSKETRLIALLHQLGAGTQCKENNDLNIECNERCTRKE